MFYHVVRRHPNTATSSAQSRNNQRSGSVPPSTRLMPRYHYSRTHANDATNHSDSISSSNSLLDTNSSKSNITTTMTNNNNNNNNNNNSNTQTNSSYSSFKSTIIPLVGNNQTATNKREFVQIPIIKEESTRSIPINVINQTNSIPPPGNNNNNNNINGNLSPQATFTNLLRPTAKYFQYHRDNSTEGSSTSTALSGIPRLPTVPRRLSLTIPVTTTTVNTNPDDDIIRTSTSSSTTRQIPIRLSQPTTTATVTSTPIYNSRISSSSFQSSPVSNNLQRQRADIGDSSLSTPTLSTDQNSSQTSDFHHPTIIRRAEVLAREALQNLTRLHHQQRNNNNPSSSESNPNRFSNLSRRVIINLKNNQTISLDSRLSSATKPPPIPSSSRHTQRNNLFHIPVLHEIQMSSQSTTNPIEDSPSSISNGNNNHFKNELHMEIPVAVTTNIDQENHIELDNKFIHRGRRPSSTNQTLKSILKRSSSRETVSRKNVSFMNA